MSFHFNNLRSLGCNRLSHLALPLVDVVQYRGKLINVLRNSNFYDAVVLLDMLRQCPTLYEERVLLYERVNDHRRALSLLVNELANHPEAESYCVRQFQRKSDRRTF